jgi:sugar phosphate permease
MAALSAEQRRATIVRVPLQFMRYVIAFIDRSNISAGVAQMNSALGMTAAQFALAASLLFSTYVLPGAAYTA